MTAAQIEVKRGGQTVMASVEHATGNYAVVTHGGEKFMAKQALGAWREMTVDEAVVRLGVLEYYKTQS